MRSSIIDARFNDEFASESIAEHYCVAVSTHLIRDSDTIFHNDFRLFFKSGARRVPDFSQVPQSANTHIDRNYDSSRILHTMCRTVYYRSD